MAEKRIQWEVEENEHAFLEGLKKELRIDTWKNMIIEAFNLFTWTIGEVKQNRKVVSLGEDGSQREYISKAIIVAKQTK